MKTDGSFAALKIRVLTLLAVPGPAGGAALARHQPHGAGGGGHAVRGREERQDLLPRLLQALPPQVQGVR